MLPQASQEQIVSQIVEFAAQNAICNHLKQKDVDDQQLANQCSELVALTIFILQGSPLNDAFATML